MEHSEPHQKCGSFISTYRIVLEETLMYFDGELPNFDGHLNAFFTSKTIENKLRRYYL